MTNSANPKATPQPRTLPVRILCAEDDPATRANLGRILTASGFTVTLAADGADAWAAVEAADFDLLITDYEMPRMDGFELATKIRAGGMTLPIIFISGCIERVHQVVPNSFNIAAILAKPCGDGVLLQNVVRALEVSNDRRADSAG